MPYRFLLLLALAVPVLLAQTNPTANQTRPPQNNSVMVGIPGGVMFANVCESSDPEQCEVGQLYIDQSGPVRVLRTVMPPPTGQEQTCEAVQVVFPVADAPSTQVTIDHADYLPETLTLHHNGLLYTDRSSDGFAADYGVSGPAVLLNRPTSVGDVIQVRYRYPCAQ